MGNFLFIFCLLALVSCGKPGKSGADGANAPTSFGLEQVITGIDFEDIDAGLVCANGGVSIFTFLDDNSDGVFQSSESVVKVKALCNGLNGSDGVSSSVTVQSLVSSQACPSGGVKISSSGSIPVEICNGSNGVNGLNGADGTLVQPVKFCEDEKSTFPEYGLMIGKELFAVYWGSTPASPNTPQAFLTKLVPGKYQSTGGDNCLFAVE